jgi:hypothetical protein
VGVKRQSEEPVDQTAGESETAAQPGPADVAAEPASEGGTADESGAAGASGRDGKIWDDLPPEVEYPHRTDEEGNSAPRRLETWRRRSAAGAILSGFAFGLREVLEPDRNEPAIVMETSGVPPKDLPVEADIDEVPPKQSVVRIRPWLLPATDDTAEKAPTPSSDDQRRAPQRPGKH